MIVDTLASLLMFGVMALGLGWPAAARISGPVNAPEKLLTAIALSLLGVFLFAWGVYVLVLPLATLWVLPLLSVLGLAESRGALREAWQDQECRELAVAQALVTAWCVGWLALVVTYSGGGWTGDCYGHWERTRFFLEHGPRDIRFSGFDPLTSRPPLANILVGAFVALTKVDFAHYQLALTFLGSLAFVPAALLARRFGLGGRVTRVGAGRPVTALLAVLFMLNPLWVQNATFAWTKLPAAFFTLASVHYFFAAANARVRSAGLLCALTLAAALLTHYSAGPYAVILAAAWIISGWKRRHEAEWWRETMLAATVGTGVLATWFGWALLTYGPRGTFLTNTSVTEQASSAVAQLTTIALNLRDTIVPHFLRTVDPGLIAQSSPWGWWRDWFFQLYQVNLLFAFGSLAWLVVIVALVQAGRTSSLRHRVRWMAAIAGTIFLGVAAHGARDAWGLAHICLQPLVLVGLAFLAARWDELGRGWRRIIVAGATIDLALGIALQFGVQSLLLDQWLAPARAPHETLASYNFTAVINLRSKLHHQWEFFGDSFAVHDIPILALLGALLLLALFRTSRRSAPAGRTTTPT